MPTHAIIKNAIYTKFLNTFPEEPLSAGLKTQRERRRLVFLWDIKTDKHMAAKSKRLSIISKSRSEK
jgi:hypothetical protein